MIKVSFEMTGGWEFLNSFSTGAGGQKDQAMIRIFTYIPPHPQGKGLEMEFSHSGQWFNQSCLRDEASIKSPKWWSLESFGVGEQIRVSGK